MAAYHGERALLIGPAFSDDASLRSELATHGVALWTVEDLASMLQAQVGPDELRPALAGKVAPSETPALTKDALWMLVDTELTRFGLSTGASEDEYGAAFAGLLASGALREDGTDAGYIVVQPLCPCSSSNSCR